jgi:fatty acid desaturase
MAAAMVPVAVTQIVLLTIYTVAGGPWAYLLLHILPIMTLYPLQIRVRSIAEHGFEVGYQPTSPQEAWMTRTSQLNVLERWIIAPFGQYLHYEHHVFPSIPNYNLPHVHRLLMAAGIPVPTNRSYFGFLFQKMRAEWRAGAVVRESV